MRGRHHYFLILKYNFLFLILTLDRQSKVLKKKIADWDVWAVMSLDRNYLERANYPLVGSASELDMLPATSTTAFSVTSNLLMYLPNISRVCE